MTDFTDITHEVDNGLAWITINRPERYNAFRTRTRDELISAFEWAWASSGVGFGIGGGHLLHGLCDLTIAADTAVFGQNSPRVGSFDAGVGTGYLARLVGEKRGPEFAAYHGN
jgi:naphthoate synthase